MSAGKAAPVEDLHRQCFDATGSPRGAAVLLHGHGDYSSRYEEVLKPFTRRGITVFATDLPGHGRSPGKRGFVPGTGCVDEVVAANLARAREVAAGGPVGLLGHSAGGLLALRELLLHPTHYDFAWLSSPLIRPEATRHPFIVSLLRQLARWLPGLNLSTGVNQDDCRHSTEETVVEVGEPPQFHNRISLGWGTELVEIARQVREGYATSQLEVPILFTQGGSDLVCPPEFLRDFLAQAKLSDCSYREFADQLHEPFLDDARDEVRKTIGDWLGRVLADRA